MASKLTNIAIRNAKPGPKPIRLFDGGGLYLEISPAGGKHWRLKYRYGGKEKRLALGSYPTIPLAEAREGSEAARKLLASGVDPSVAKRPVILFVSPDVVPGRVVTMPGPVQLKVNGEVPPLTVTLALPLLSPLQVAFTCVVMARVSRFGSVTLNEPVAEQPFASVTV